MKGKFIFGLLAVLVLLFLVSGVARAQTEEFAVIEDILEGDRVIITNTKLLGLIQGNVTVEPAVTFQVEGIIAGNLLLKQGATLILNGIVYGDVTLQEEATATINGIVGGNVHNQGGQDIEVNGIVKGEIY